VTGPNEPHGDKPHQDFGWFRAVKTGLGRTWWSERHGCFALLFNGPSPLATGAPGPRLLAWGSGWCALEHTVGVSLFDLLRRRHPDDIPWQVRARIVGRALSSEYAFLRDGWEFPPIDRIDVGFDGSVTIRVGRHVELSVHDAPIRGHADSLARDSYDDWADTRYDSFSSDVRRLCAQLRLPVVEEGYLPRLEEWARFEESPGLVVTELFPKEAALWRSTRELMLSQTNRLGPPPGDWQDVITQEEARLAAEAAARAAERARQVAAYRGPLVARLDALADADADLELAKEPFNPAEDAPIELHLFGVLRDRPLRAWTRQQFDEHIGLRIARRRAVARLRGGPDVDATLVAIDDTIERALCRNAPALLALRPWHDAPPVAVLARVAAVLGGTARPPADDDADEVERQWLLSRRLFATEAFWTALVQRESATAARVRWRANWIRFDDALVDADRRAVAESRPRLPPLTEQVGRVVADAFVKQTDAELPVPSVRPVGGAVEITVETEGARHVFRTGGTGDGGDGWFSVGSLVENDVVLPVPGVGLWKHIEFNWHESRTPAAPRPHPADDVEQRVRSLVSDERTPAALAVRLRGGNSVWADGRPLPSGSVTTVPEDSVLRVGPYELRVCVVEPTLLANETPAPAPSAPSSSAGRRLEIVVMRAGQPMSVHPIDGEINVGRIGGNDILITSGSVSKRHARLYFRDGVVIAVDIKTTTGTFLNGRRLSSPAVVKEGEFLQIGDAVLEVRRRR
jgi:hypothetical protein